MKHVEQVDSDLEQDEEENQITPQRRLQESTGVTLPQSELTRTIKMTKRKTGYNFDDCAHGFLPYFTHSSPPSYLAQKDYNLTQSPNGQICTFDAGVCITDVLPESVLSKCLFDGYLDTAFMLQTLSCVSKTLYSIAKETVRMLDLRRFSMKTENVQNIVSRFQNLSFLDLNHCPQFSDSHLINLSPLWHSLTVLRLRGTAVTDRGVVDFFLNEKSSESSKKDWHGMSFCCCGLEELDLSATTPEGSLRIGDRAFDAITSSCPHLRKLLLGWCARVTDKSILNLIKLRHLRELDLSLCNLITSESCKHLSNICTLRRLDISATKVDNKGVVLLAMGTSEAYDALLDSAEIVTSGALEEACLDRLRVRNKFNCQLESLSLRFLGITVLSLEVLGKYATKLQLLETEFSSDLDVDQDCVRSVLNDMKKNGTMVLTSRNQRRFTS